MSGKCSLVIIGGGPAGLAAAIYAGRADMKPILLERALVGGQVAQTMDIANYPGFPEGVDGPQLAEKMQAQAERFGVEFRTQEVLSLHRDGDDFLVKTKGDEIQASAVILASGADPRLLSVPGEKELRGRGVSYCGTCDGPFFRNKRVVVVGGGDSALKEALHLCKFVSELTLVHRRDELRGEKIYQRQVFATDKINIRWDTVATTIKGENNVESVILQNVKTKAEEDFATDGVFIFVGSMPNTSLLKDLLPQDAGGHVQTDADMMTAIPGLFAVGDVRANSYRQVATAVGEGATAAMAVEHYFQKRHAKT